MATEPQSVPLEYPLLQPEPSAAPVYPPLETVQPAPACCTACKCDCTRAALIVFLVLQVLVFIGQIITLASQHWLQYCFWDFGLLTGESRSDRFSESGCSFSLEHEYCKDGKEEFLKGLISQYCPLFCVNIWLIGVYGVAVLSLGVISILTALYPAVLHVLALLRPTENSLIHWLMLVPLCIWTFAWGLFYAGTLSTHFDHLAQNHAAETEDSHTEVGCALWMAMSVSVAQLVLFLFVFFCTRKSFEKRA